MLKNFAIKSKPTTTEWTGTVLFVKTYNEWGLGSILVGNKECSIKGEAVASLKEGFDYTLVGNIVNHSKYGESLEVLSAAPYIEPNPRAIEKYLVANFKNIGEKSAKKMVGNITRSDDPGALEAFRQQILTRPWSLDWSASGREGVFDEQADEDISSYISRDLATRIGSVQAVGHSLLNALARHLNDLRSKTPAAELTDNPVHDAWKIFSKNPYMPIKFVPGYAFITADTIALSIGIKRDDPLRLQFLASYALETYCDNNGHVYLGENEFQRAISKTDPVANATNAIKAGLEGGLVHLDTDHGASRYYTAELLEFEKNAAVKFNALMDSHSSMSVGRANPSDIQHSFQSRNAGKSLDPSQIQAIATILNNKSRLHVLTGGPGCGKTALVETIVHLLPNRVFQFCAPTGKAAKVLGSRIASTKYTASTIHSLLMGTEADWKINQDNMLPGDVLIVDESSMLSLSLWNAVLNGMNNDMHLIVVGDPNQLRSIQAGRVLSDILQLPNIDHQHLTEVHRNSGGILDVVNDVRDGLLDPTNRDSVSFSHKLGAPEEDSEKIIGLYKKCVAETGLKNTLLLMSRRIGRDDTPGWNTTYANHILRGVFNPDAQRLPGCLFHKDDRIIIKKNMSIEPQKEPQIHDKLRQIETERVVNGDTGTIISFEKSTDAKNGGCKIVKLLLDDGRYIDLPGDRVNTLQWAYALTVHAAQGSEYKQIIAVLTPGQPSFVNRSMVMTGLSRAKDQLYVFANDHELQRMVATESPERNSALVERVALLNKEKTIKMEESSKKKRSLDSLSLF